MHLTSQRIFAIHPKNNPEVSLAIRLRQLLDVQKQGWRDLAAGCDALHTVKTRTVQCSGLAVNLQFNPGRIQSTSAVLDEESLRSRQCFLCYENMPDEQRGILFHDQFLILCNPAPIFDLHFTVSHIMHRPQSIEAFPGVFLDLARELNRTSTVFYNGPRCGASAPDHMHFQICPVNVLPIETIAASDEARNLVRKEGSHSIWTLSNCGRQAIVLECSDKHETESVLFRLLDAMKQVLERTEEPLVNILCSFKDNTWRLIIFPRTKHRPEAFSKEGNDQVLISPAAVDLAGVVVTPVERDFTAVDAATIEGIFREVSLDGSVVDAILGAL